MKKLLKVYYAVSLVLLASGLLHSQVIDAFDIATIDSISKLEKIQKVSDSLAQLVNIGYDIQHWL